jgi:hypothetical protein
MTRAGETPIVVPHDWGLSVVFGQIKNAPAARTTRAEEGNMQFAERSFPVFGSREKELILPYAADCR